MIRIRTNKEKFKQGVGKEQGHIVLVANTCWSIYNFRLGLIRRLKDEGYHVSVIAPRDQYTSKLISEGIDCHELRMKNYGTNPIADFNLFWQLLKLYKAIKPDLIFHYTIKPNIYGSIAAAVRRIPSIAVTTGLGHLFQFSNIFVRWISLFSYKIAASFSKEMWFLNTNDRDIFIYKNVVKLKKTRILKSEGIDTTWFTPVKEKDFTQNRFLFAGRLIWDKGVREYILAAERIKEQYPDTEFEIVGFVDPANPNSVPYSYILEWQKKGVIKYLGETEDIRPLLQNATCFVFPSFYREGISRVLMEAAAMETPIVTTDNVGCRDVVEHGKNGILVVTKSVDDLVTGLERFIEMDVEDRLIMAKRGRQKVIDEFSEKAVLDVYMDVISKQLETSHSHALKKANNDW